MVRKVNGATLSFVLNNLKMLVRIIALFTNKQLILNLHTLDEIPCQIGFVLFSLEAVYSTRYIIDSQSLLYKSSGHVPAASSKDLSWEDIKLLTQYAGRIISVVPRGETCETRT